MTDASMLLAQFRSSADRIDALRKAFDQNPVSDMPNMLTIAGIVAGACVVILLLDRLARLSRKPRAVPREDYLARAAESLELRWYQLRDLRWVAHHAGFTEPAALLLAPATLANATDAALARSANTGLRQRMSTLCEYLFQVPLPAPQPTA